MNKDTMIQVKAYVNYNLLNYQYVLNSLNNYNYFELR